MATAHDIRGRKNARTRTESVSKRRHRGRTSPKSARNRPTDNAVPPQLENAIEAERRHLQKAASTLACLVLALEYEPDEGDPDAPDCSDVARAVRIMVNSSIEQLDSINLARRMAEPVEASSE